MVDPKVLFQTNEASSPTCNSELDFSDNQSGVSGNGTTRSQKISIVQKKSHRKKTQRQIPASKTGEEFGLVPVRFLKRSHMVMDDTTAAQLPSATVGATPPRKSGQRIGRVPTPSIPQSPQHYGLKDKDTSNNRKNSNSKNSSIAMPDRMVVTKKTQEELCLLQQELNHSLQQRGGVLAMIHSEFVEDWKAACLRAEGYDIPKATLRVLFHWRAKSELFGTPDLKVTINDIAPNILQSGMIQLIPVRDLAGRAVVCMKFDPQIYGNQEREVKKYLFYMLASALEDEETQDKGLVLVVWNFQGMENNGSWGATATLGTFFDSFWNLWKTMKTSFRISRLHYITVSGEAQYSVKEHEEGDTSVRHHTGSPQECLHALLMVGLPVPAVPIMPDGLIEREFHHKWIEWRQRTDSYHHQHQYEIILVPNRHDILFGRHPISGLVNVGNIYFHQQILANVEGYYRDSISSTEQATICFQIYKNIINTLLGGDESSGTTSKFLHPLDMRMGVLWEPMGEKQALEKIADALEFVRRQMDQQEESIAARERGKAGDNPHETNWAELWHVKQCCFMVTCKEGYRVCESSKLSKDWSRMNDNGL